MKNQLMADIGEWSPPAGFDKGVVVFDDSDTIDWTPVLEMSKRREWSKANAKPCPICDSMQVQLVDWSTDNLKLKCRHCKHVHFRMIEEK